MKKDRIDFIDFAKGFSVLSIVIFHYCQPYAIGILGNVVKVGGAGVHLFFIVSGFGLGMSSQEIKYYDFFKRRVIRILIPYYIFVITAFSFNQFIPIFKNVSFYALVGHLFAYKMFDEEIIGSFGYHLWFMSTIIQFYIFFKPVVQIKKMISSLCFVAISLAVSICYWVFLVYVDLAGQRVYNSFFLQYLWEFNIGLVLADLYREKRIKFWDQNIMRMFLLAVFGLGIMGVMAMKFKRVGQTFNDIPAAIGFFSLTCLLFLICEKYKLNNMIQYVGVISYELYLIHMFIFLIVSLLFAKITGFGINVFISLFVVIPVSILVSVLFKSINSKLICRLSV